MRRATLWVMAFAVASTVATAALAQEAAPAPAAMTKIGPNLYRIGQIDINTATREVSVPGRINDVVVLEWVATTKDGRKGYESAITLQADAISFNTAMLLIGLDKSHARVPERHFDPIAPAGDPVDIFVEWTRNGEKVRVGVEQLLWDRENLALVPLSSWVYTGSSFFEGRYMAEQDGTLIGFVHSPAPIIEQVGAAAVGRFGRIVLNPNLGLTTEIPLTVIVKNRAPAKP